MNFEAVRRFHWKLSSRCRQHSVFLFISVRDNKLYECPVYRKPVRSHYNYIGAVDLESDLGKEIIFNALVKKENMEG